MPVKTKKLVLMALLTAIALTIFLVEAAIPPLVPVPGVKLGLANIVTVFAVFALGSREGAAILFCRVFLGAVFSGTVSVSAGDAGHRYRNRHLDRPVRPTSSESGR